MWPLRFAQAIALTTLVLAACSKSTGPVTDGASTHDAANDAAMNDAAPAGSCAGGATFQLEAPDPTAWFAVNSFTDCSPHNWLYVLDASGSEIQTFECCGVDYCDVCGAGPVCQAAFTGDALPASKAWDGTVLPTSQCGTANKTCVITRTCALAGHYQAKMCAYRGSGPTGDPVCVTVPFDLPASAPVVGTLPQ
jgi:hypothetical protein